MRAMGLHGHRPLPESPRTTRSAPKEQCPADLVNRHLSAFRPNELWARGHSPTRWEVPPPMCAPCPGGCTWLSPANVLLPQDHRLADHPPARDADLAQGRPEDGCLAAPGAKGRTREGLIHHTRPGRLYRAIRYGQAPPTATRSPRWDPRAISFRFRAGRGPQLAL